MTAKKNDPKAEADAKAKAAEATTSVATGTDTRGRPGLRVRTKDQGGKPLRMVVRGGQKFSPDARFVDDVDITPAQRKAIQADPCLEVEVIAG